MAENEKPADDPLDWENRRLCPDESCIGIIGPDGRCTECGRPADREQDQALKASAGPGEDTRLSDAESPLDAPDAEEAQEPADAVPADNYWKSRQLCPDGNCIGVIGPNGRCKVCGRKAADGS